MRGEFTQQLDRREDALDNRIGDIGTCGACEVSADVDNVLLGWRQDDDARHFQSEGSAMRARMRAAASAAGEPSPRSSDA